MRLRRTRRPWFGPKRVIGWGWRVTSWQGWVVTVIVLGMLLAARAIWGRHAAPAVVGLLAIYLVIIVLTGDPPGPGGLLRRGAGDGGGDGGGAGDGGAAGAASRPRGRRGLAGRDS